MNARKSSRTGLLCAILAIQALSGSLFGQTTCDSVNIISLHYHAIDSNVIEVQVENFSSDIFAYPSFILFNTSGDTLAQEIVNFFGIGGAQSHYMQVMPGASIPSGPFDAILELHTGFGNTLACTWNYTGHSLCPPGPCEPAIVYFTNNTGTLWNFAASWTLYDANNQTVDVGTIWMDTISHTHFDTTVCLPPGEYRIEVIGFFQITDQHILGITDNYATSIGTNTVQQNDTTPEDLNFSWYGACADMTNAISETNAPSLLISQIGDELIMQDAGGTGIGTVSLFNISGQLALQSFSNSSTTTMHVGALPAGVYVIHRSGPQGVHAEKLFLR